MILETIKAQCDAACNREGKPHAVFNLNRVGRAMYVVRDLERAPLGVNLVDAGVVYMTGFATIPTQWEGVESAMATLKCLGYGLPAPRDRFIDSHSVE